MASMARTCSVAARDGASAIRLRDWDLAAGAFSASAGSAGWRFRGLTGSLSSCALGDPAVRELAVFTLSDYEYEAGVGEGALISGMYTSAPLGLLTPGHAGYITFEIDSTLAGAGVAVDRCRFE